MAGNGPRVLLIADDPHERMSIGAMLRDAGFALRIAAAAEPGLWEGERLDAAIVVSRHDDALATVRLVRLSHPGLPALLVLAPGATPPIDDSIATIVKRPIDQRQLLGCAFEMVLRDADEQRPPRCIDMAEYGIAAAKLACLRNRHAIAAAAGAQRLAHELARQIGETVALRSGLAATAATGAGSEGLLRGAA